MIDYGPEFALPEMMPADDAHGPKNRAIPKNRAKKGQGKAKATAQKANQDDTTKQPKQQKVKPGTAADPEVVDIS